MGKTIALSEVKKIKNQDICINCPIVIEKLKDAIHDEYTNMTVTGLMSNERLVSILGYVNAAMIAHIYDRMDCMSRIGLLDYGNEEDPYDIWIYLIPIERYEFLNPEGNFPRCSIEELQKMGVIKVKERDKNFYDRIKIFVDQDRLDELLIPE